MTGHVQSEPDFFGESELVPVMDFAIAAHRYATPHVHDSQGRCIRDRLSLACSAPPAPKQGTC